MYLTEARLIDVVKKQFVYKLKAYPGVFGALLLVQLLAIALGYTSNSGGSLNSNDNLTIQDSSFTNDIPVIFTFIWAFMNGILVTTVAYRNDAFTFISNRISHHFSSILLLLTACSIAGITASLTGPLIKFMTFLKYGSLFSETFELSSFLIQVTTSISYTILFASVGYLLGSFIQLSKWIVPVIIIVLLISPYLLWAVNSKATVALTMRFFFDETSLLLFLIKVVGASIGLFAIAIAATNKTEVRK